MEFPELIIGGIALVPVIVAIIELAKKLGFPTEYAPWLNGLLSIGAYALVILVTQEPSALDAVTYALNALVIFLSAAGFYDRTVRAYKKK